MGPLLTNLLIFLLGGTLGSLCDKIHLIHHILSYPNHFGLSQPWWVFPLFGTGILLLIKSQKFIKHASTRDLSRITFFGDLLCFVGLYCLSGTSEWFYYSFLVCYIIDVGGAPFLIIPSLLAALSGTIVEILLSSMGAFSYTAPDYYVPMWLPLLYMYGALCANRVFSLLQTIS